MTAGKTIALTRQTFAGKVMSLYFNMLSRLVIAFLPRSKSLLIAWLQSQSAVILEPLKWSLSLFPLFPHLFAIKGPDAMILVFWMLSFKSTFSLSSFPFMKRLFSSTSLSAIRVESSVYLRLVIFIPAILIPAYVSSSSLFLIVYSAFKLSKQGDNRQPQRIPFLIWNQSVVPCLVLTVASTYIQISQEAGTVVWYSHFFDNFSQFAVIHTVKGFGIVNKAEVDVFLECSCFFSNPTDVGNLISCSSAFSKSRWKPGSSCTVKVWLGEFWALLCQYVWDELKGVVVWAFFGIAFLWDWNESWPFPVLWPLLSFPNLLAYWVQHFHSIIF